MNVKQITQISITDMIPVDYGYVKSVIDLPNHKIVYTQHVSDVKS